jgi:hypothetical protein
LFSAAASISCASDDTGLIVRERMQQAMILMGSIFRCFVYVFIIVVGSGGVKIKERMSLNSFYGQVKLFNDIEYH